MNERYFDLGGWPRTTRSTAEDEALLVGYFGADAAPAARLALMKIVSDFREAMWGVVQQGISVLDVDYAEYVDSHFDRLLRKRRVRITVGSSSTPRRPRCVSQARS